MQEYLLYVSTIYLSFTNTYLYHTTSISIINFLIKHLEEKYEKERKQTINSDKMHLH